MDEVGDDFLAGAAFAGDQQGGVARRDALDGADNLLHRRAVKNGGMPPLMVVSARRNALASSRRLFVLQRPLHRDLELACIRTAW